MQSEQLNELATALSVVQAKIGPAVKDSVNPHFKNRYASLQSVWDAARPVLTANGLSVVQTFNETDGEKMSIVTTLLHKSGQWINGTLTLKPQRADPQGIGSAVTYGRRYALAALLGIVADDDDDAEAATKVVAAAPRVQSVPAAAKAKTSAVPRDASPDGPARWEDAVIHFGKNKGKTLLDLPRNTLDWYISEWQPKPYNGAISLDDVALRKALDAAGQLLGNLGPKVEAEAPQPDSDEVPF